MKKTVALSLALFCLAGCGKEGFDALFAAAEEKIGIGDSRGALKTFQRLARHYPDDPRRPGILLRIGDIHGIVRDEPESAVRVYGEIIEKYPFSGVSMLARERRAEFRKKKGDFEDAIEDYAALLKYFPDHADRYRYRMLLGDAFFAQKKYDQARDELRPLLKDETTPAGVRERGLFTVAESFFLEGSADRAVPYYQTLLKEFPTSGLAGEARLHLAVCAEEMGYLGVARDITKEAMQDYPNKKVIDARLKSIDERGKKSVKDYKK